MELRSTPRWLLALILAVLDAGVAVAEPSDRDVVAAFDPAERASPQLVALQHDLWVKGQEAQRTGEHPEAIKYFSTLTLAAPQQSRGFSGLCASYRAMGRHGDAVDACLLAAQKRDAGVRERAALYELLVASSGRVQEVGSEQTEPFWYERLGWIVPLSLLFVAALVLLARPGRGSRRAHALRVG